MRVINAFEWTHVPHGDDNAMVRGCIVRCPCGSAESVRANTLQGTGGNDDEREFEIISRKLVKGGWRIGRKRRDHRCPKCVALLDAANSKVMPMSQTTPPPAAPIKIAADNIRQITREDRRIIFEKLNEVYVSDKVGYAGNWTDDKLAQDLGVPRAWVRLIRDENFGDEAGNEDLRKMLIEARTAVERVRAIECEMRSLLSLADKLEKGIAEATRVMK
ncbi:hypothetical protein M2232_002327 [Bradyrhizobium japonicum]|uniref:hypothetical protein n=1 Tax=Bradyrhizobium japonicum TaxID=375 RepID=UPI002225C0F5|nr:hypothetical protein [Bradyrhizobium japonicum]MCW2218795.1 hypothetical protein [Bradyrhizobium japonicum]MCW2343409.1 hypothetical protein [Bradyrhizobium japonicum]